MTNCDVPEWKHDIEYRPMNVVCIKWTCLSGAIIKYDYFCAILGDEDFHNLNRNPITFPQYWARLEANT